MDIVNILNQIEDKGYFHGQININEMDFKKIIEEFEDLTLFKRDRDEDYFKIVQDDNSEKMVSIAKSSNDFTPHTECVNEQDIPDYLFLYCTENASNTTMKTYIVNTYEFFNGLSQAEQNILRKIDFVFVSKEGQESTVPLIRNQDEFEFISLTCRGYFKPNYKVLAHPQEMEIIEYIPVLNKLTEYIQNEENFAKVVELKKGELLAIDNRKMLHGRINVNKGKDNHRRLVRALLNRK